MDIKGVGTVVVAGKMYAAADYTQAGGRGGRQLRPRATLDFILWPDHSVEHEQSRMLPAERVDNELLGSSNHINSECCLRVALTRAATDDASCEHT